MNYEFKVDAQESTAYLTLQGDCEIQDLERVIIEVAQHKGFNPELDFLNDFREANFKFRSSEMWNFYKLFSRKASANNGKSALIVSEHSPTEDIMTIHEKSASHIREMKVFSTCEEGLTWLKKKRDA